MLPLSVVIITYNEEKNLLRCIKTAKQVADEIVVIDSYSTDATRSICLENNVVFIQNKFSGYGDQKQFGTSRAGYDHILNLDADEFLSEELAASILEEKKQNFPSDAYTMNRLNRYCGRWIRHGCWYPDKKLRLFNRKEGNWNNDLVHENVVMKSGALVKHLKGDLLHHAYESVREHQEKNEKYSSISAENLYARGTRTNLLKIGLNPLWAFVNCYFFRLGLLDGFYGFIIACNIWRLTYLKHAKLYEKQKSERIV